MMMMKLGPGRGCQPSGWEIPAVWASTRQSKGQSKEPQVGTCIKNLVTFVRKGRPLSESVGERPSAALGAVQA